MNGLLQFLLAMALVCQVAFVSAARGQKASPGNAASGNSAAPMTFASGGKFKMLYDARQRPQSVYQKDRLYIVYNGDAEPSKSGKGNAYPMFISYEPESRMFSSPVRLGDKKSSDHHYSPIIWVDEENYLHVLYGCHRTPGTHLISKQPVEKGRPNITWLEKAPSFSVLVSGHLRIEKLLQGSTHGRTQIRPSLI